MTPPLVRRAGEEGLAAGPLLHVLAAQRGRSRVGSAGLAGASWVVSALAPEVPFVVALEEGAAVPDWLAADESAHVLAGGLPALAPEAPFDLLVSLGPAEADELVALLAPGGTVVAPAPLAHPRLVTVELPAAAVGVRSL